MTKRYRKAINLNYSQGQICVKVYVNFMKGVQKKKVVD